MEFEHFSAARDFLYLSAVLIGFAAGCIAWVCTPRDSPRQRSGFFTLGLCFLSASLAAFAAALIRVGNPPLALKALIPPACITALLAALAFRFPRILGFPVVLLGGLLVVWLGYSFLRFPQAVPPALPLASVRHERDNVFRVSINAQEQRAGRSLSPPLEDTGHPLEFSAGFIRYGELFPLIGGVTRGGLSSIYREQESLADGLVLGRPFLLKYYAWLSSQAGPGAVSFQRYDVQILPKTIPPGLDRTIFFDGAVLSFH